ncbi:ABC transporter ATP-binding protein [Photobacterium kishitanii]|uniref:metal ABC transporter ATP-binding protein n=1 Tax=Photobacterium kishitanii TaxID=318456 RepID=UPI000D176AC9|nr:metal ABC transporter ATP-binding protein [Photobacterium kishitanii]PSW60375.1 ABC transporter ATP-binding protein [Photobacterium kishitanii]
MISVTNLTVYYRNNIALDNISCTIKDGDLVAIVGPNGAGKSTLLKVLMKQISPMTGKVCLGQYSMKNIAYLPQSTHIDRNFPITVEEFISAGAWRRSSFWRRFTQAEYQKISQALVTVQLSGMEKRQISELSGGQFQRMLFARMLIQDAQILLLDEPFAAIDAQTSEDLMAVIRDCQQQGKTVVAVMHDLSLVARYFPEAILVATQLIANGNTKTVLQSHHLQQAGYQAYLTPCFEQINALSTPQNVAIKPQQECHHE